MKIADKEQLKIGDTVYTAQPLCLKWKNFRYPLFRKETIERITPKRTREAIKTLVRRAMAMGFMKALT